MKRISLLILILILLLSACGSDPKQLTEVDGTEAEELEIFIKSYKESMIEAVNTGDFNELESYLITNNSFYHSLRRYINDLHSDRTTKELDAFEVENVYVDEIGEYHIDVNERITILEFGQEKIVERSVRYELVRGGNGLLRIVTIREKK